MTIPTFPGTPPSLNDPANFPVRADAGWAWLANDVVPGINSELPAIESAGAASAVALAASNYKGEWSARTGAAAVPYAVSHDGGFWQLVSNLADVTSKTPGVDAEWLEIPTAPEPASQAEAEAGTDTTHYMTAQRTTQAIAKRAGAWQPISNSAASGASVSFTLGTDAEEVSLSLSGVSTSSTGTAMDLYITRNGVETLVGTVLSQANGSAAWLSNGRVDLINPKNTTLPLLIYAVGTGEAEDTKFYRYAVATNGYPITAVAVKPASGTFDAGTIYYDARIV